jgi:hypothetical protein
MAVDLEKYNLSDPEEFIAAAGEVAESVHKDFGTAFATKGEGGEIYLNVGVVSVLVAVSAQNALVLGLTGNDQASVEIIKLATTLKALIEEATLAVSPDGV